MLQPLKATINRSIARVTLLTAMLSGICLFIVWDHHRVDMDFLKLKALLTNVRSQALRQHQVLIARFRDKAVSVTDNGTGAVIQELNIPTLDEVNYDTTLGKDMIVFYDRGTGKYNKRIHGGDIRLRSCLGFRKDIAVNCTGLALEGTYPEENWK